MYIICIYIVNSMVSGPRKVDHAEPRKDLNRYRSAGRKGVFSRWHLEVTLVLKGGVAELCAAAIRAQTLSYTRSHNIYIYI